MAVLCIKHQKQQRLIIDNKIIKIYDSNANNSISLEKLAKQNRKNFKYNLVNFLFVLTQQRQLVKFTKKQNLVLKQPSLNFPTQPTISIAHKVTRRTGISTTIKKLTITKEKSKTTAVITITT